MPMQALAACLRTLDRVASTPHEMSRNFSAHMSARKPLNFSPQKSFEFLEQLSKYPYLKDKDVQKERKKERKLLPLAHALRSDK